MYQTFDVESLSKAIEPYKNETAGFVAAEWLKDVRNIALTDGEGNYNLFQFFRPGLYFAHTFYHARGKKALQLGEDALKWVFSEASPIHSIQGITPMTKPAARWFNRKLGLKSYGVIQTINGPCELFIIDRHSYAQKG